MSFKIQQLLDDVDGFFGQGSMFGISELEYYRLEKLRQSKTELPGTDRVMDNNDYWEIALASIVENGFRDCASTEEDAFLRYRQYDDERRKEIEEENRKEQEEEDFFFDFGDELYEDGLSMECEYRLAKQICDICGTSYDFMSYVAFYTMVKAGVLDDNNNIKGENK